MNQTTGIRYDKELGAIVSNTELPKQKGGCDLSMKPVEEQQSVVPVIPPERVEAMKQCAVKLRRKHPHMKPDRLKKKVAEYFKVKLV